ncbi:MAG: MFS transporter [Rhodovulum sulfidophilum]|uniref:MFS transporter n=1 Tax=Rhodovulum sulfidophilum TaxID=35806 RepID=A0A2W5N4I6_RHOSU|nr:MAG: MFS transporter [Rhodovulum sulfidophilum]
MVAQAIGPGDPAPAPETARWPAIVSLSLGVFGLVTSEFLPVSLLTPMSEDLGVSTGAAGQAMTVTAVVAGFAGPATVILTRRLDRRGVLLALTALLLLSNLLSALATSYGALMVARAALGVALGGFWAMSAGLAMRLAPPRLVPRALAVVMTGVSLASILAAPFGAWIGDLLSWRHAFGAAALVGLLALVAQALTVPRLAPSGSASLGTLLRVLRRPTIHYGLLAVMLVMTAHFAGFTYIRPYLETVPKLGIGMISAVLSAFGVAGFLGNLAGAALAERGTRRAIGLAAAALTATSAALAFAGWIPLVAVGAILVWGFAFAMVPVSAQTLMTVGAPDEAESAGALNLAAFQVAISSGAVFGGLIVDSLGPAGIFMLSGLAAFLGLFAVNAIGGPAADGPCPQGAR